MTLNEPNSPPIYGLVLAGGKSTRMGQDKSLMAWHGVEQRYYMAGQLRQLCSHVYISIRPGQESEIAPEWPVIADTVTGAGPLSGILSAFRVFPQVAWLVTACDLPLLDARTLQYLIAHRQAGKIATTFRSPFDGLPEPLITLWEPAAYPILQSMLAEGLTCPRKALIRNEDSVSIIAPPDPEALFNANTPGDAARVREILAAKPTARSEPNN